MEGQLSASGAAEMEPETLELADQSERRTFFPVYGRPRVGKTELILQFMKDNRYQFVALEDLYSRKK